MKKGFTLIELLAVIVILAIIALIATPIILGIINDAREEANERSFDLYASAVRNAIAAHQLKNPKDAPTDFSQLDVETDGGNVDCTIQTLHSDGSFYLAGCTVNGTAVDYTYGIPYKPQYYGYIKQGVNFEPNTVIGESSAPENPSTEPPTDKSAYVGYDVTDGIISEGYACFVKSGTEYCLKAKDPEAYETNKTVLVELCGAKESTSVFGTETNCKIDDMTVYARTDGTVYFGKAGIGCSGSDNCWFACFD